MPEVIVRNILLQLGIEVWSFRRGPTKLMSPRNTLTSSGSSSKRERPKSRFFDRARTELYALMAMSAYNPTRMAKLRPLPT